MRTTRLRRGLAYAAATAAIMIAGCQAMVHQTDRDVADAIAARQTAALGERNAATAGDYNPADDEPGDEAYSYLTKSNDPAMPAGFEPPEGPEPPPADNPLAILEQVSNGSEEAAPSSQPTSNVASAPASSPSSNVASAPAGEPNSPVTSAPASMPTSAQTYAQHEQQRYQSEVLTLTRALAYAQQHRREYLSAKEDLYLAALALTLERHLWTPQFAASLRSVYGNYGEIRDFDQAVRFVADLSVSQRLPYGGEFTAEAISTLIRDVKQSITGTEESQINLGLSIPFLRGAGHVARESLINLERELTYAVRTFERFRRRQLVTVAQSYFSLLRSKQAVIDAEQSAQQALELFAMAKAFEEAGERSQLDTRRAEQDLLQQLNSTEQLRESFRFATDQFKLDIGMPVDERIGIDDLEDIESIERQIKESKYPLLRRPPAAEDEVRAIGVAEESRLDVLNTKDAVDDAKRGVSIAKNALLPELDWDTTLTFDTEPEHYKLGAFEVARATWRSEVILSMDDRFSERNQYRRALISVRQARRTLEETLERLRVEVRRAINQIRLQDRLVVIQEQNLSVARKRVEFAEYQYDEGEIGNFDLVEARNALLDAQNRLNQAKTDRWSRLLDFRLATETMRVDESGVQIEPRPGE